MGWISGCYLVIQHFFWYLVEIKYLPIRIKIFKILKLRIGWIPIILPFFQYPAIWLDIDIQPIASIVIWCSFQMYRFSTSGLLQHLKTKHSIEKPTSANDCNLKHSAGDESVESSSKCLKVHFQPTFSI